MGAFHETQYITFINTAWRNPDHITLMRTFIIHCLVLSVVQLCNKEHWAVLQKYRGSLVPFLTVAASRSSVFFCYHKTTAKCTGIQGQNGHRVTPDHTSLKTLTLSLNPKALTLSVTLNPIINAICCDPVDSFDPVSLYVLQWPVHSIVATRTAQALQFYHTVSK